MVGSSSDTVGWMCIARCMTVYGTPAYMTSRMEWTASSQPVPSKAAPRIRSVWLLQWGVFDVLWRGLAKLHPSHPDRETPCCKALVRGQQSVALNYPHTGHIKIKFLRFDLSHCRTHAGPKI